MSKNVDYSKSAYKLENAAEVGVAVSAYRAEADRLDSKRAEAFAVKTPIAPAYIIK